MTPSFVRGDPYILRACIVLLCVRGKFNAPLAVDSYDAFIGLKVWASGVLFGRHPHALALAWYRLRSHQVGQDDVTIKSVFIDVFGWSIETRTTS